MIDCINRVFCMVAVKNVNKRVTVLENPPTVAIASSILKIVLVVVVTV